MTNIFQRIGEALASQGRITLVAARTPSEGEVLKIAGFKNVGSTDIDGDLIDIYEVKITQVINTPPKQIKVPIKDEKPSWPYQDPWPKNYRLYSNSSSTPSTNYRGITSSLMDAAYNPLSILEDYFFTDTDGTTTFKIQVDERLSGEEAVNFINEIKDEIQSRRK